MDVPKLAGWSYLSADYEVARDRWNDVAIEIYHDRKHPYNVARMIEAVKKSLAYFSREFVDVIREVVPAWQDRLIEDLFENITIYDVKAREASVEDLGDGRYTVRVAVEAHKFRADGQRLETEIQIDDWIDVAVFGEKETGGPASGRLLAMEKHRITETDGVFEIESTHVRCGRVRTRFTS